MKLFITGSTGFLGKNLCKHLVSLGHEIHGTYRSPQYSGMFLDGVNYHYCNLSDLNRVEHYLDNIQPDVIIHLASNPTPKPNFDDPNGIIRDNIISINNLLASCSRNIKFINASSIIVYGNFTAPAVEYDKCYPTSIYATTKITSEHLVNNYVAYKNLIGINLRLCAMVGPNLTHGLLKDLIYKSINNSTLELIGSSPGSCKPYLHIDDAVKAFELCLNYNISDTFNITNEIPITVLEVAQIVLKELEIDKDIMWTENAWIGDNNLVCGLNHHAQHQLGWKPFYTSKKAIQKAVRECKPI